MNKNQKNASQKLIEFFNTKVGKVIAFLYISFSLLMTGIVIFGWFSTGELNVEQARPIITIILPILICLILMTTELNRKHKS
ncbi:hypothetical protein ASL83_003155 [Vibrio parahaemolyticus]|uniref:Uncharacterized protein n=1 Tax=Vibrio parahaemolyticus TaxID=670 RepID=A0A9Q3YGE6_VIBPH|nr:hypothetical protein [Vibrio parahaemolyticus]EJE4724387.1 hypothetical protein [Vibrio parahaemolyticus]MCC3803939.1 hypothetical protein [Vibrio parahaemolyticus]